MKLLLTLCLAILAAANLHATTVSGTIKDKNGALLPFSSVLVKGTTQGASANSKGMYSLQLAPGEYTLVAQFIGYKTEERKITVTKSDETIDFTLEQQQYNLRDVVVKSGGEDPAYEIIRKTIAKREEHLREIRRFQCEVYIKGQMQLRNYPRSFLGKKIDFEDGDTSKRKMLFLSETVARYSVLEPGTQKVEVLSTKVSGRSNSFGLADPQIISFYENNISVGEELNPRGFISPIASGALGFYKYKFEGTFYENGKEVSRIKVIPRRKYEPLFSGYINIIENEWRLQSVDLLLLREQQMQFLDTLRIQQLYVPSGNGNLWVIKNQVIYPAGKLFAFDFFGTFVQVYDKFDMNPSFKPKFFDRTVIKFYDSSNKKTAAYWDSIRPLPLLAEEKRDYTKKDSLEKVRQDPHYLDSLDKKRNKITLGGILFSGQSFYRRSKKERVSFNSVLGSLNYNTVEGAVLQFTPGYSKRFGDRKYMTASVNLRYGITSGHLNPSAGIGYGFGKKVRQSVNLSGGKSVLQYNGANPITPRVNSIYTLLDESNYMKIYEAYSARMQYNASIGKGVNLSASFQYMDRLPLENLPDPVTWHKSDSHDFTPNYPMELTGSNMPRNQAATVTLSASWKPGMNYMELPDDVMIGLGSKYPTLSASITKGINGLFGSDVDYTRWRLGINDDLDFKLGGKFKYNVSFSGFFDARKTYIPDYIHFLGNQTLFASRELASFQLAPYYRYSNTAKFNIAAHAEYHLNGLITNKIPFFKKLNWFFVTGANALHVDKANNYYEVLFGLENILKVLRVDFVQGFEAGGGKPSGIRIATSIFD